MHSNNHIMNPRRNIFAYCIAALAIACKDTGPCTPPPCPQFEAVTLMVSTPGTTSRPPGLAIAVNDGPLQTALCDTQDGVCHVFGGPGDYRLTISATGFTSQHVQVTVTGDGRIGCNTCGHVDRQQLTVVLQPAS
jgi:hypothetical protein